MTKSLRLLQHGGNLSTFILRAPHSSGVLPHRITHSRSTKAVNVHPPHNETLLVAAKRVCNPDHSPVGIHR
jgi:hypothetical protein